MVNHLIKFAFLERTQGPVSAFCYARNQVATLLGPLVSLNETSYHYHFIPVYSVQACCIPNPLSKVVPVHIEQDFAGLRLNPSNIKVDKCGHAK